MRYVALLRGINLGSSRRVGMAALRETLAGAGFDDVATYLQSGNVVLTSGLNRDPLRARLEEIIAARFGIDVGVLTKTAEEMTAVVEGCPYPAEAEADPTKVHATFLEPMPPAAAWESIDADAFRPDEYRVGDGLVYLHMPNGMARAKLPDAVGKVARDSLATSRNWRTVLGLRDLAAG